MPASAAEIIRTQRDGGALTPDMIGAFVRGLVDGTWADSQVAALAMAIVLRGLGTEQTVALTRAMLHSGEVLQWQGAGLSGPIVDKHSTGGVGDKVSLMLAPILAACGAVVPMISGRGLGHTGGTLDKLEALPGYNAYPARASLLATLRTAGCAIVGAGDTLAPADRRLYAIRDVTATVESVPLITASILSKKLAAGLQALVLDVKFGSGAFTPTLAQARELATSLVTVARGAGLAARALITDMNQVLGWTAGNALETREAIDFLAGGAIDARLRTLTLALAAEAVHLAGLAATQEAGHTLAERALTSGAAAEHFARMVAGLGGPPDVLKDGQLPSAPIKCPVLAPRDGFVTQINVRALGLAVVTLGGGRTRPGDAVDPRVGLADVASLGTWRPANEPLAWVHAANHDAAQAASAAVRQAITLGEAAPLPSTLIAERVSG